MDFGLRWEWLQPWYTQANNMANFVPSLYDPSKAVAFTSAGTIVPGSGNLYNGLIRAGDGIPQAEIGRVPGSTNVLFNSIPAGAPRGFFQAQNMFSPRFGFAFAVTNKTAYPVWSDTRPVDLFLCPGTGTPTTPPEVCEGGARNASVANDEDIYATAVPIG